MDLEKKIFEDQEFELIQVLEGNLIDNYLMYHYDTNKYMIGVETYKNCWSSVITLYEATYKELQEFEENYYKQVEELEEDYKNRGLQDEEY